MRVPSQIGVANRSSGVATSEVAAAAAIRAAAAASSALIKALAAKAAATGRTLRGQSAIDQADGAVAAAADVFEVGQVVTVDARSAPGQNREGGVARIVAITRTPSLVFNVKYVLGGTETGVPARYVHAQGSPSSGTSPKESAASGGPSLSDKDSSSSAGGGSRTKGDGRK